MVGKIEYVSMDDALPKLEPTYDYDESACVFDVGEVIENPDKHPHHFKFIQRNEYIKVLNERIIEKAENGILTSSDMHEYREIVKMWNNELWELYLKPYAITEAQACFSGQNKNFGKMYDDIVGEMALTFLQKLPNYNPYRTKPTTYFKMSFKAVVAEFKAKDKNITPHYAYQYSKITDAFYRLYNKYETAPDMESLQQASGLTPAIFKRTLDIINSSNTVDVDRLAYKVSDHYTMPEAAMLEKEKNTIIHEAIEEVLSGCTEEEIAVFQARISETGEIAKFTDIATKLGMKVSKVRQTFTRVQRRLQENESLMQLYSRSKRQYKNDYINPPDNVTGKEACDTITNGIKNQIRKNA